MQSQHSAGKTKASWLPQFPETEQREIMWFHGEARPSQQFSHMTGQPSSVCLSDPLICLSVSTIFFISLTLAIWNLCIPHLTLTLYVPLFISDPPSHSVASLKGRPPDPPDSVPILMQLIADVSTGVNSRTNLSFKYFYYILILYAFMGLFF